MILKALLIWFVLCLANFVYQHLNKKDWGTAGEISFFQALAIGLFVNFS